MSAICLCLKLALIGWSGASVADNVTTYQVMAHYRPDAFETNPFLRPLQDRPVALSATMAATDLLGGWALYRFAGKTHPKMAALGFVGLGFMRGYFAAHNMHTMGTVDQLRAHPVFIRSF